MDLVEQWVLIAGVTSREMEAIYSTSDLVTFVLPTPDFWDFLRAAHSPAGAGPTAKHRRLPLGRRTWRSTKLGLRGAITRRIHRLQTHMDGRGRDFDSSVPAADMIEQIDHETHEKRIDVFRVFCRPSKESVEVEPENMIRSCHREFSSKPRHSASRLAGRPLSSSE